MASSEETLDDLALVVSCPTEDLEALVAVLRQNPIALLPVGGVGELGRAAGVTTLLMVEIGPDGALPTIRWRGSVGDATPVADPAALLPATWAARHPHAYADSRTPPPAAEGEWDEDRWDDDEKRVQVFLPLTALERLAKDRWVFANELVSKQHRAGRTFAPRVPALVSLPDD